MDLICSARVALILVTFRIYALCASFSQPPSKSACFWVMPAIIGQWNDTLCTFPGSFYLLHVYMQGRERAAMNNTLNMWFLHTRTNESEGSQGCTLWQSKCIFYNLQAHAYLILRSFLMLSTRQTLREQTNRKNLMLQTGAIVHFVHWWLSHLTYLLLISLLWSVVMDTQPDRHVKYTCFLYHEIPSNLCRLRDSPPLSYSYWNLYFISRTSTTNLNTYSV